MSAALIYQRLKTPNCRFLYQECGGLSPDFDQIINHLLDFIENSARLERANPSFYQYFFCAPTDEDFDLMDSWLGLEVVGMVNLEEEENFAQTDLDRSSVYSFALDHFSTVLDVKRLYTEAHELLLQQGHVLASTWRLSFAPDPKQGGRAVKCSLDFFPDEDCGTEAGA